MYSDPTSTKMQALHVALELAKLNDNGKVSELIAAAKRIEEYIDEIKTEEVPF